MGGVGLSLREKAKRDFPGWCERFVHIKTKTGMERMRLNKAQRYVWQIIQEMEADGLPARIIILKSRQMGLSTLGQAVLAHKAFLFEAQNCLTIGQNADMAGELFGKTEMIWQLMPDFARPPKGSRTRGKRLQLGGDLQSLLYVDSAENRDAGRSGTFQHVHATEIPFWPDAKRTMDGLLQSVPKTVGTTVIVESTARGVGDYFHQMWQAANASGDGWNGFTPIFLPWFWDETYRREAMSEEDALLSPDEEEMQEKYGLDLEQVLFYRDKRRELGEEIIKQEYPCNADEAFLTSGTPFFGANTISFHEKRAATFDVERKFALQVTDAGKVHLRDHPRGELWIWEKPLPNTDYVIVGDPSSGLGEDFTGLHILKGYEQVASYKGKIPPDELAALMNRLGLLYNEALLAPEANNMGIVTVSDLLKKFEYPNLYQYVEQDTVNNRQSTKYGWHTSSVTRPMLLGNLAKAVRSGDLVIRCPRTIAEMRTFVVKVRETERGRTERIEHQAGEHDDLVIPLGIGVTVLMQNPVVRDPIVRVKSRNMISRAIGY